MWDAQADALRDFDVVRIDHPGHDRQPMIEVRDVGDLARRVLGAVESERFSFIGLSLGGAVGMQLALEAPERLDRLVLACTSARFGDAQGWDERIELYVRAGWKRRRRRLPRWFTPAFGDVQRFRAMFLAMPRETYVRYCEILREFDLRGKLGAVEAPTLAVAGAEDPRRRRSRSRRSRRRSRMHASSRSRAPPHGECRASDEFNYALGAHLE
jgi:pimeloyl-ACP methyl ester carboxylesterase